jgi:hypothetical protein
MAMDNFDIFKSTDIAELYQNANNENVKDLLDDLKNFIKNNKNLDPKRYISGNIQTLIQAQIATDKAINYDFLKKITELEVLSLHGDFSKIKTYPFIFYNLKNILLTRRNIQQSEINQIIQIADMYLKYDAIWENLKNITNDFSDEDKTLIFAFLSPEKFKKHYKYLKLSTIFERLTLINNITTSSMTELDDSMNIIKILKKIIKDKIPFEIENSLENYASEDDDYGDALVIVRILYEKGLLKKEDIVKNSVYLKELILILFQNRTFKNDKLKSEVFNYYKKILPQENGGNQYHLSMKIMSFIEKINRSIFMDKGKVVEKHDPLKDFIKDFFNAFVNDEEKKEFFRNAIGIVLSYHRASKTSTRDYKSIFDMITEYQRDLKITDDDIEEYFLSALNMAKDIHIIKMLLEANFRMDILVNMLNKKDMNYFYNKISNYRNSNRYSEFEFVLKYIDKDKLKEIIEKSVESKQAKEPDYKKMIEVANKVLEEKQTS